MHFLKLQRNFKKLCEHLKPLKTAELLSDLMKVKNYRLIEDSDRLIQQQNGTSVDDGARKLNNWLGQWQSGKLGSGSRV